MKTLREKFSLTAEDAEQKMQRYWKSERLE